MRLICGFVAMISLAFVGEREAQAFSGQEVAEQTRKKSLDELDTNLKQLLTRVSLKVNAAPTIGRPAPETIAQTRDLIATQIARAKDMAQLLKRTSSAIQEYKVGVESLKQYLIIQITECQTKIKASATRPKVMEDWQRSLDLANAALEAAEARLCLIGFDDSPESLSGQFPNAITDLEGRTEALMATERILAESAVILSPAQAIETVLARMAEYESHNNAIDSAIRGIIGDIKPKKEEKQIKNSVDVEIKFEQPGDDSEVPAKRLTGSQWEALTMGTMNLRSVDAVPTRRPNPAPTRPVRYSR
jgi:hypothetical protein